MSCGVPESQTGNKFLSHEKVAAAAGQGLAGFNFPKANELYDTGVRQRANGSGFLEKPLSYPFMPVVVRMQNLDRNRSTNWKLNGFINGAKASNTEDVDQGKLPVQKFT